MTKYEEIEKRIQLIEETRTSLEFRMENLELYQLKYIEPSMDMFRKHAYIAWTVVLVLSTINVVQTFIKLFL